MKKIISLIFCILLSVALAIPTCADLIWEPDTPFFNAHREECIYHPKSYYVKGIDGKADVYDTPNGKARYTINNDAIIRVEYRYENWVMLTSSRELYTMWVSMDDLEPVYDYQDYISEHPRTDKPMDEEWGEIDKDYIVLWDYPGSSYYRIRKGTAFTGYEYRDQKWDYYADENGIVYLFMDYYYGREDGFVRVSDPCSTETLTNEPSIDRDTVVENYVIKKLTPDISEFGLPALLVLCTIVLSVFLLSRFRKKGKYEQQ